jgi:hypothetical protein
VFVNNAASIVVDDLFGVTRNGAVGAVSVQFEHATALNNCALLGKSAIAAAQDVDIFVQGRRPPRRPGQRGRRARSPFRRVRRRAIAGAAVVFVVETARAAALARRQAAIAPHGRIEVVRVARANPVALTPGERTLVVDAIVQVADFILP